MLRRLLLAIFRARVVIEDETGKEFTLARTRRSDKIRIWRIPNRWRVIGGHALAYFAAILIVVPIWWGFVVVFMRSGGASLAPAWSSNTPVYAIQLFVWFFVLFAFLYPCEPLKRRLVHALTRDSMKWWYLASGLCPSCRYDVAALAPDANARVTCPECGGVWKRSALPPPL
ncbi:MAG: hypothetical protein IPK69_03640 [Phycisphaerales bacterium]|nr:MAG: hypothetical protein IPK69_03640 [Phycisphaerales bacterium]